MNGVPYRKYILVPHSAYMGSMSLTCGLTEDIDSSPN